MVAAIRQALLEQCIPRRDLKSGFCYMIHGRRSCVGICRGDIYGFWFDVIECSFGKPFLGSEQAWADEGTAIPLLELSQAPESRQASEVLDFLLTAERAQKEHYKAFLDDAWRAWKGES